MHKIVSNLKPLIDPDARYTGPQIMGILACALLVALFSVRRMLRIDAIFVGNDLDISAVWHHEMQASRLWTAAGTELWWQPFRSLGSENLFGACQPWSLLVLLQRVFSSVDKGLDHTLIFLTLLGSTAAVGFFLLQRFSGLAALIAGTGLILSGSSAMQLFAGHIGVYAALCLCPIYLVAICWANRQSSVLALVPAVLAFAAIVTTGEPSGVFLALWTCHAFLALQILIGSPWEVPQPTVWSWTKGAYRAEQLVARVPGRIRLREFCWLLLRLTLVSLWGAGLSASAWIPMLAHSNLLQGNPDGVIHSAPLLSALNLFVPHLFLGAGQTYNWVGWPMWEGQVGVGCGFTVLAAVSIIFLRARALLLPLALLGLSLGVAFSELFYKLYTHLDPSARWLEVPSRVLFSSNFALCIIVAYGLDQCIRRRFEFSANTSAILARVAVGLAALWLFTSMIDGNFEVWRFFIRHLQTAYRYNEVKPVDPAEYYVLLWTRFSAATVLTLTLLYSWTRLPIRGRLVATAAVLLLDVTRFGHPLMNMLSIADTQIPSEVMEITDREHLVGKVANFAFVGASGSLSVNRIPDWNLFWLERTELGTQLRAATNLSMGKDAYPGGLEHPSILTRFLGVSMYLYPLDMLEEKEMNARYKSLTSYTIPERNWGLAFDSAARAPLYVTRAIEPCKGMVEMFRRVVRNPIHLGSNTNFMSPVQYRQLLEDVKRRGLDKPVSVPEGIQDQAVIEEVLPTQVTVQVQLTQSAMVILNQAWAEGWRVSVDGFDARCLPCQMGLNRGVLVGPGRHKIEFTYQDSFVLAGRWLAWITLVVSALSLTFLVGVRALISRVWDKE